VGLVLIRVVVSAAIRVVVRRVGVGLVLIRVVVSAAIRVVVRRVGVGLVLIRVVVSAAIRVVVRRVGVGLVLIRVVVSAAIRGKAVQMGAVVRTTVVPAVRRVVASGTGRLPARSSGVAWHVEERAGSNERNRRTGRTGMHARPS
jgi:hypothetical protein